ncbi:MAG: TerB N-terminal domain-containing protein [Treponema sp.]|jgi:hypothetical protein|nr:TerB N-terminal domain-containing protein [Treponema sp.]
MQGAVPLTEPFFTLKYDPSIAAFRRELPADAVDLGNGRFRRGKDELALPEDSAEETKILRQEIIRGKDILALVRRGYNRLVKAGPSLAEREDRLMELGLLGGLPGLPRRDRRPQRTKGETARFTRIQILFRKAKIPEEQQFPLEGLPCYRLYENRIYEILPEDFLSRFFPQEPGGGRMPLSLQDEEIPAFADNYARLIYVFADRLLYSVLSQDRLFADPESISLILRCVPEMKQGVGTTAAVPALKYGKKLYSALALSRHSDRKYLPLEDRWIRREALEKAGIGPLGRFINGESLGPFRLKPLEALSQKGMQGLWRSFEWDRDRWLRYGSEEEIFFSHLEFLRALGLPGGIVAGDREKAAACLAAWLRFLAEELRRETGRNQEDELFADLPAARVLVLTARSFWDHRLVKELPRMGSFVAPPGKSGGGPGVWDPGFLGIGIGFYGDLPMQPRKGKWDILVLTGAEEVLAQDTGVKEDLVKELRAVQTRLKLGVFFSSPGISDKSQGIGSFFGIKGNLKEYEKYLFRETGEFLSLPQPHEYVPSPLLNPPRPWEKAGKPGAGTDRGLLFQEKTTVIGGGRFTVEAKFQNLQIPEYREEQELFSKEGTQRPFTLIPARPGEVPDFDSLNDDEKEYFLWWRSEFRKGRLRETCGAYILLYCRELILLIGGAPEEAFAELERLGKTAGDLFPDLKPRFTRWLLDFAVIHNCPGRIKPSLGDRDLDTDLYLHRKYIEENHSLEFGDFVSIIPKSIIRGPFRLSPEGRVLDKSIENALNTIDGALRKGYGKKLLEFFYPLPPGKETIAAFEGLPKTGCSSYTAEWISFSRHKPFVNFLSSLAAWLEYRLKDEKKFGVLGAPPRLEPLWKHLAGLSGPADPFPEELGRQRVELEAARISRLREESDAVMEMLRIEREETPAPDASPAPQRRPSLELFPEDQPRKTHTRIADFIGALDKTAMAALDLISRGSQNELDALARENGTMAALIIDRINEGFLESSGDLLIESSVDEGPVIQAEYRDEVVWALTFRNGSAQG